MTKLRMAQTTMAASSAMSIRSQPGQPVPDKAVTTVQAVTAPIMRTSPCAKLIRLITPYTMVYPRAMRA